MGHPEASPVAPMVLSAGRVKERVGGREPHYDLELSPDAAFVAYTDLADHTVRVRGIVGEVATVPSAPGALVRFSADSRFVAVAAPARVGGAFGVSVIDLATGGLWDVGAFQAVERIAWARDGLVIHHTPARGSSRLTWVPKDGEGAGAVRTLVDGIHIYRMAAAPMANDVVYFSGPAVWLVSAGADASAGTAIAMDIDVSPAPRKIADVRGTAVNAEVAPDGAYVTYATLHDVLLVDVATGKALLEEPVEDVHSLWLDPAGRTVAWASPGAAAIFDGHLRPMPPVAGEIAMLRFVPWRRELVVLGR